MSTDIINATLEAAVPAAHSMGVQAVDVREGHARTSVPVEGNGNHFGAIYAGVLFTVAEVLGGAIAFATFDVAAYYPLVKKFEIEFVSMARTDLTAEATLDNATIDRVRAEAAERGKSDFVLDAVVTDANGKTVATTHGLYQLRAYGK